MTYEAYAPETLKDYINVGSNTAQFVANDSVCGADAYRIDLRIGATDLIFDLKDLQIDNISESLWIDIYNDSERTMEIPVFVQKGKGNYYRVYEAYHLDETMTITLKPGMNHVEISGYALLCGERTPTKNPVAPDSLKLSFTNYAVQKLAITNMYVEKG